MEIIKKTWTTFLSLTRGRLSSNKWYSMVDQVEDEADDLIDALNTIMTYQPLRYVGLVFEFSDDYQKYRIKNYGVDFLYKLSTEEEIIKGLEYSQLLGVGIKVSFCKKCNTIRVFGKKCLICNQIVLNQINTNELNLKDYASSR